LLKSGRTLLAVGEKNLDTFNRLKQELGGIANKQAFLIAMTWGMRHATKPENLKRSNTGVRLEYLKGPDEALLTAMHLAETNDPQTLTDIEQRLDLAERYADGGLLLLAEMLDEPGEFARVFAGEVKQQVDGLKSQLSVSG
jgi:hypothetical protein